MPTPPSHLTVYLEDVAVEHALTGWRWMIGPDTHPLCITAAGDVVLAKASGSVFLLDTGGGALELVAESLAAFERGLSDRANLDDWFSVSLVDELQRRGVALESGQCYGYAVLPVFREGSYGPDNRRVLSALEHLACTADIHSQIRNLPDGAKVRLDIVE